jgi:hypothetical protein
MHSSSFLSDPTHAILFDQRNSSVSDARPFGQLALRQAILLTDVLQAGRNFDGHRCTLRVDEPV